MDHRLRALGAASAFCTIAALTSVLLTSGSPAFGETSSAGPLTVTMSLASNHVTLGEPLVLYYKISSPSQQEITLHMGKRDELLDGPGADIVEMFRRDWLTMGMKTDTGQTLSVLPDLRRPEKRDMEYNSGRTLFIGNRYTVDGYLVVSEWFSPPRPGNYTLTIHVRLPYAVLPEDEVKPATIDADTLSAGTVLNHDYVFPVAVQGPDASRLQAVAETLRKSAEAETDVLRQRMLIQSLFSMPEAAAWPSWETLVNSSTLYSDSKNVALSELERVRSITAADILARMLPGPKKPNTALQQEVCISLAAMYRGGDARMKSHIKSLFLAHGIQPPENKTMSRNG